MSILYNEFMISDLFRYNIFILNSENVSKYRCSYLSISGIDAVYPMK